MRTCVTLLASFAVLSQVIGQESTQASAPVVPAAEPAVAASAAQPEVSPASASGAGIVIVDTPAAATTKNKDTLSVDFPDEEIRTILRNVADLFELNLVIPDTLQGRTSLKLREVTWRQIFQVILNPIGYTFVEDGNIIKILSQASLAEEPLATEIFIINYAKADDVKKSIESIIDGSVGGKVVVDTRSNALVITERPSRMAKIRPIVDKLDRATEQVTIESKFIQITDTDARNLGLSWPTSVSAGVSSITNEVTGSATAPNTIKNVFNTAGTTTATFTTSEFSLLLNALEQKTNSRLVNNPTLVTLNNVTATINIGVDYPIPSYTYNADRGTYEISGFQYKSIGVNLNVTPQINSQGFIKLTLEPEISDVDREITFGGGASAATIPVIKTTKTKTQVSLKDGHTLGIGGLLKDTNSKTVNKVPFLGSIPVLGKLFTDKDTDNTRENTLIFITAKVVDAQQAAMSEIFDPRVLKDAKLKRSDITGYRDKDLDPFIPEVPAAKDAKK